MFVDAITVMAPPYCGVPNLSHQFPVAVGVVVFTGVEVGTEVVAEVGTLVVIEVVVSSN